jgi:hypothetical protein
VQLSHSSILFSQSQLVDEEFSSVKLLQCDFGALCTAILVVATLAITVPFKVSFHSKLNTALQRSASAISCSSMVCQAANRSQLAPLQEMQTTAYHASPQPFSEQISRPLSRKSSKEI